jgi:hypothetical protein
MAAAEPKAMGRGTVLAFALILLLDFVVIVVMLATDKNLQTDFGSITNPSFTNYYAHWYALLAEGILTLLVALALCFYAFRGTARPTRAVVLGAFAYSVLAFLGNVGIVAAYQMVGYSNLTQFADYLYGITASSGDIRYLYDVLIVLGLITIGVGGAALRAVRKSPPPAA